MLCRKPLSILDPSTEGVTHMLPAKCCRRVAPRQHLIGIIPTSDSDDLQFDDEMVVPRRSCIRAGTCVRLASPGGPACRFDCAKKASVGTGQNWARSRVPITETGPRSRLYAGLAMN